MVVLDPVCGMTIQSGEAAASLEHEGHRYFFCTNQCSRAFERDPLRFVSGQRDFGCCSAAEEDPWPLGGKGEEAANPVVRRCPYCTGEAHGVFAPVSGVGRLSTDEFSTIVMGEWRRRLGRARYDDPTSPDLIRVLIEWALIDPVEPSMIVPRRVREGLVSQVRRMRDRGRGAQEVEQAFLLLSVTLWDVLSGGGLTFSRATEVMVRLDRALSEGMQQVVSLPLKPAS